MSNENKPISIIHAEFVETLVNLINNSHLPLFVVESVLKDVYSDVRILAKQQYDNDLQIYKKAQKQDQNK